VLPGSLLSVLRPLLTPANARGPLLAAAPVVADRFGLHVSLSNNVNSRCTTGPFISGVEHGAAPGLRPVVRARPLRQPYMVFLFVGSSALTGSFLPTGPRDSAVASV
jgi:hypothetical protein